MDDKTLDFIIDFCKENAYILIPVVLIFLVFLLRSVKTINIFFKPTFLGRAGSNQDTKAKEAKQDKTSHESSHSGDASKNHGKTKKRPNKEGKPSSSKDVSEESGSGGSDQETVPKQKIDTARRRKWGKNVQAVGMELENNANVTITGGVNVTATG